MARRRRTGITRQPWDCLAAERRVSGVNTLRVVSGIRAAITGGAVKVLPVETSRGSDAGVLTIGESRVSGLMGSFA